MSQDDFGRGICAHRALAASRAIAARFWGDNFFARAFPPFDAPR